MTADGKPTAAGRGAGSGRFVLFNAPTSENAYHNFLDFVAVVPPIGITSIAAVVERAGCEAEILDADAMGLTVDETVARIVQARPGYIGATTMTATMDILNGIFVRLKKELPEAVIVVGGPHASAIPEQTLNDCDAIDVAVIGEGDETVVELLDCLTRGGSLGNVGGIAFRRNAEVVRTAARAPIADLSSLPLPAYHLLDFDLYRSYMWNNWVSGNRSPIGVVFAGRGCFGRCNFCGAHCVFGHGIRYFPADRIEKEIDFLVERYGIRVLYFQDDTFNVNRRLVNRICDFLIDRGYNNTIETMVSARVDTAHAPTLKRMRQAGIRWICYGVESGNQQILDRMHKDITLQQTRDAFRLAREADMCIAGNFMIGHLGETRQTAMDTIDLARELDEDYASFAIAIPFPGTELYQHCLDNGIEIPPWNDFGNVNTPPIPLNPDLGAEELMELRTLATSRFFKRPVYLLRMLVRFNAVAVIRDFLRMYMALLRERRAKRF